MNEDPGDTPNPLNPSREPISAPGAVGSNPPEPPIVPPTPAPTTAPRPSRPVSRTAGTRPAVSGRPASRSVRAPQTNSSVQANRVSVAPAAPVAPVVPVASSEPAPTILNGAPESTPTSGSAEPKKKKTGVVIGLIASLFVAVGCAVAAVLFFMNPGGKDAVSLAMNKLVTGETPSNVKMNGSIDVKLNNPAYPISELTVDFDSEMKTGTSTNSSQASMRVVTLDDEEYSFDVNEVYTSGGDLYLKLDGWEDLITGMFNMMNNQSVVIDCGDDEADCKTSSTIEECDTEGNCSTIETTMSSDDTSAEINEAISVVSRLDGEWLRISADDLDQLYNESIGESPIGCIVDSINDVNSKNNSLMELYNQDPFVVSSTDNVNIKNNGNPIYRIMVNNEKFANFVNSAQDTNMLSELNSCLGLDNTTIDTNTLSEVVSGTPNIFVEVDKNDNFTRLYIQAEVLEGDDSQLNSLDSSTTETECDDCKHKVLITADFNFSYPDSINVVEPTEYSDFFEVIDEVFSGASATDTESN